MRPSLALLVMLALVLLLGGCTLIDVQWAPHGGVDSRAFVSGYADAGWAASNSLLKVGLFDGPSRGALFYFQIWKLFRFEVGFLGLALGIGPLDAGVGVFFYDPHPPAYIECDEECEEESAEDEAPEESEAKAADVGAKPFVYSAY